MVNSNTNYNFIVKRYYYDKNIITKVTVYLKISTAYRFLKHTFTLFLLSYF